MLKIAGAHRMWMKLDAAQIHDPRKSGRVIDYDLLRFAPRRKRQRHGSQP
jgi:hypothetical protein